MELAVGSSALSFYLQRIFQKLESAELWNLSKQVRFELQNWKCFLPRINDVLEDAVEKEMTNHAVKMWLSDLSDLAYKMMEVLDQLEANARRQKLLPKSQASTSIARRMLPFITAFMPHHSEIKDITVRLKLIEAQKNTLGLITLVGGLTGEAARWWRPPVSRVPNDTHVYGRESAKEAILHQLLNDEGSDEGPAVIAIVGMGGVGKTTLARLVYQDERVNGLFELRAWCLVSGDFDLPRITREITESIARKRCDYKDLPQHQEKLNHILISKKFLVVLDDVWNTDYYLWDALRRTFESGAPGSKIIITTRSQAVARLMAASRVYHLELLSRDSCLSLFTRVALGTENFDEHPNLKGIGEELVEMCRRLPLALKMLGGMLRSQMDPDGWEAVLKNRTWECFGERSGILPVLKLSYDYLPPDLKLCFAFCALFPKDYEFDKGDLVSLWIAEGLLQGKEMERMGHSYISDLLSRSFFQVSSDNVSRLVMHDLVQDLAQYVSRETCCNLESIQGCGRFSFERVLHLSFFRGQYDTYKRFQTLGEMKSLRTFLQLSPITPFESHLSDKVVDELLPKLRGLRMLSFSGYSIQRLPDSIGKLECLLYLNLSGTEIQILPDSVGSLVLLRMLLLCGCRKLTKLPATIVNLSYLHHLDISETESLKVMPLGIYNLKNLLILPKFIVGEARGLRLKELNHLKDLQGKLHIFDLHKVLDVQDASEANLCMIEGLDEITLEWTSDFHNSRNKSEKLVLGQLRPHYGLKRVKINYYGGLDFPSWIGHPSFSELVYLELHRCQKSTSLPSIGQLPLLKELVIRGMHDIKDVELESSNNNYSGSFPSLEKLTLEDCPKLRRKLPSYLPFLMSLKIGKCPQLIYSPMSLPSVRELNIGDCNEAVLRSMIDLTSLAKLKVERISKLACLSKSLTQCMTALETLEIGDCGELAYLCEDGATLASLKSVTIRACPFIASLTLNEDLLPCNLEVLKLFDCHNLEHLPNGLHRLASLQALRIERCKKLRSFPVTGLPSGLKFLYLNNLGFLESLPNGLMMMAEGSNNMLPIEVLSIARCPRLRSFPMGKLPNTLKSLTIEDSENLDSLPEGVILDESSRIMVNLEYLKVSNLPSLMSFPSGELPNSLETVIIEGCIHEDSFPARMLQHCTRLEALLITGLRKLQSLPVDCMHNLSRLVELKINDCKALESFSESGISITNLKTLWITDCNYLKSLPNSMYNLTSLQELRIQGCPRITSIPEGGLPTNLHLLQIDCKGLNQPMREWGFNRLTALQSFEIHWICPPDNLLPTSLRILTIQRVHNLKSISKGLLQHLNSLVELEIKHCPKLQSLPKEGLPSSLGRFSVRDCPLLGERCLEGDYEPLMYGIPRVKIDGVPRRPGSFMACMLAS